MNPYRVVSEQDLQDHLAEQGFEKTGNRTATGEFWKSTRNGKHILVPDPYEGFYPEVIIKDLQKIVGKITPVMH